MIKNGITIDLKIGERVIKLILDTGSTLSLYDTKLLKNLMEMLWTVEHFMNPTWIVKCLKPGI